MLVLNCKFWITNLVSFKLVVFDFTVFISGYIVNRYNGTLHKKILNNLCYKIIMDTYHLLWNCCKVKFYWVSLWLFYELFMILLVLECTSKTVNIKQI